MDDITSELGISKKTLYQYFSDKDSLINAIIDLKLENDRAICLSSIENAENAIDGNFFQTENNYFVIVYYKENNQRYDRVIGRGIASSVDITN